MLVRVTIRRTQISCTMKTYALHLQYLTGSEVMIINIYSTHTVIFIYSNVPYGTTAALKLHLHPKYDLTSQKPQQKNQFIQRFKNTAILKLPKLTG